MESDLFENKSKKIKKSQEDKKDKYWSSNDLSHEFQENREKTIKSNNFF